MKINKGILWAAILFVALSLGMQSCKTDSSTIIEPSFTVKDADGNVYNTIAIGNQVWLTTNLKTTKYRTGDPIPYVQDTFTWSLTVAGGYCNYEHNVEYGDTFGRLYNFYAVTDPRDLAPVGYHVATQADIDILLAFLGTSAGGKMKEAGLKHWASPNTGATNASFLTFLPGGFRTKNGAFMQKDSTAVFWNNLGPISNVVSYNLLSYDTDTLANIFPQVGVSKNGFSVRCVKD